MNSTYTPPPGGLWVLNSRTIGDIFIRGLAIHVFSICAYAQLASILPLNTVSRVFALQVVLFTAFPEFVLVQLVSYGIVALYAIIILSIYSKTTEPTTLGSEELRDAPQVSRGDATEIKEKTAANGPSLALRLLLLAINCLPLIAAVLAYRQRLGFRYRSATYVGNLMVDHRNGWIAIGGLVAAGMTLIILLMKDIYLKRTKIEERMRSNYVPPSVVMLQMGIVVAIHQFLLEATNHPTLMSQTPIWPTLFLATGFALIVRLYPKWRSLLYLAAASFFVVATALSQLFTDVQELIDVSNYRVQPYNYRWKVKDLFSARSSPS